MVRIWPFGPYNCTNLEGNPNRVLRGHFIYQSHEYGHSILIPFSIGLTHKNRHALALAGIKINEYFCLINMKICKMVKYSGQREFIYWREYKFIYCRIYCELLPIQLIYRLLYNYSLMLGFNFKVRNVNAAKCVLFWQESQLLVWFTFFLYILYIY